MPDLERVLDDLRVDLAPTPEAKAEAAGFIKGKRYARKEIAITVGIIACVVVLAVIC